MTSNFILNLKTKFMKITILTYDCYIVGKFTGDLVAARFDRIYYQIKEDGIHCRIGVPVIDWLTSETSMRLHHGHGYPINLAV
jgi:hypothetical protein